MKTYLLAVGSLLWANGVAASKCRPTLPKSSSSGSAAVYTPPPSSSSSCLPSFSEPSVSSSSASLPSSSTLPGACGNVVVDGDLSAGKLHWVQGGSTQDGSVTFLSNCGPYSSCAELAWSGTAPGFVSVSQNIPGVVLGRTYRFSLRYRVVQSAGDGTFTFGCTVDGEAVEFVNATDQPLDTWLTYGFDYVAGHDPESVYCSLSDVTSAGLGSAVEITEVALVPDTCGPQASSSASSSSSAVPPTQSIYQPPCNDLVVDGALSDPEIWGIREAGQGAVTFTNDCGVYGSCAELSPGLDGGGPVSVASDARVGTGVGEFATGNPYTVSLQYRVVVGGSSGGGGAGQHAQFGVDMGGGLGATQDIAFAPLDTWQSFSFQYPAPDPDAELYVYLNVSDDAADAPTAVEVTNVVVVPSAPYPCGSGPPGVGEPA